MTADLRVALAVVAGIDVDRRTLDSKVETAFESVVSELIELLAEAGFDTDLSAAWLCAPQEAQQVR